MLEPDKLRASGCLVPNHLSLRGPRDLVKITRTDVRSSNLAAKL